VTDLPVGAWRPDLPQTAPNLAGDVLNVLPIQSQNGIGWGPMKQLANPDGATALGEAPRGAANVFLNDGSSQVFVGTADDIYKLNGDYTWTAIGTGTFAVPTGDDWSFAHFGDWLLATNATDGLWAYDINNGGAMVNITAAPVAKYIFVTNNMVVALQCDGDLTLLKNSDFNDHTEWVNGAADSQQFLEGGDLMGGADLANSQAILVQKNRVSRMDFTGSGNLIWTNPTVSNQIGASSPGSIVSHGGVVRFLGLDGFWETDGFSMKPIGAEKINRTFLADTSPDDRLRVQGGVDPINKVIWWRYKSLQSVDVEIYQDMIGYDWQLQEWTRSDYATYGLFTLATPATTLDEIGNIDTITRSLDSYFWLGGGRNVAVIDEDYKIAFMTGDNSSGHIQTNTVSPGGKAPLIREIEPETDCDSVTVAVGYKTTLKDGFTWSSNYSLTDGVAYPRNRGRFFAFKLNIPAGEIWNDATGFINMRASSGGRRV